MMEIEKPYVWDRRVLRNPTALTRINRSTQTAVTIRISSGAGDPEITFMARNTIQTRDTIPASIAAAVTRSITGGRTAIGTAGCPARCDNFSAMRAAISSGAAASTWLRPHTQYQTPAAI